MSNELTFRCVFLAIILTVILAVSNAFLALKLGILTSASIPAAILSMGILRFFKDSNILENNLVQTAASAGEAVAGGVVYTLPALIIIQYWHGFDYWTNFWIALCSGVLGVLFSIPLRQRLVSDTTLHFPEGHAVAEVLKSSQQGCEIRYLIYGVAVAAIYEILQTSLQIIPVTWSMCFVIAGAVFNLGIGFSSTLVGAGYLIGYEMSVSIILGAIIASVFALPILSIQLPIISLSAESLNTTVELLSQQLRYIGIGAMLTAGLWVLLHLLSPLFTHIARQFTQHKNTPSIQATTEQDLPIWVIISLGLFISMILWLVLYAIFPLHIFTITTDQQWVWISLAVCYVIAIGFLFSVMTSYFSAMVGVSASPGSSVVIAGILLTGSLILYLIKHNAHIIFTPIVIHTAEALTIIIGAILTGIAAIANDNIQDLKIGALLGATPWKQQLMLLLGVLVAAAIIPLVMQLLFNQYGIAGIMPHPGMHITHTFPAPTAALMATLTASVFEQAMPWKIMLAGALIIIVLILLIKYIKLERWIKISVLGVAMGIYLPMTTSLPLLIGGLIAELIKNSLLHTKRFNEKDKKFIFQRTVLFACGLVVGSALMDIVLLIPIKTFT